MTEDRWLDEETNPQLAWRLARRLMRLPRFKGRDRGLLMLLPYLRPPEGLVSFSLPSGTLIRGQLGDEIDAQLYLYGTFEAITLGVLARCLRPADVVIDVGANIGYFSLELARTIGTRGAVHAFEPNPVTFHRLCENIRANGFPNVHCHPVALGSQRTSVELFQEFPYRSADASLRHRGRAQGSCVTVHQERLDDFCTSRAISPDLIKVDVEGAEMDVLRGAVRLIELTRPILMIEHNAAAARLFGYETKEMFRWLRDAFGYALYWIGPDRLVGFESAVDMPGFHSSAQNVLGLRGTLGPGAVADLNRDYPRLPRSYARLELWPPGPRSGRRLTSGRH